MENNNQLIEQTITRTWENWAMISVTYTRNMTEIYKSAVFIELRCIELSGKTGQRIEPQKLPVENAVSSNILRVID